MAIEPWGFLTCHTHCNTGLPYIMVISEDPWHSHVMPSVWQWNCHNRFLQLRSVATGDRTSISRIRIERSTSTPSQWLNKYVFSKHICLWFFYNNVNIYNLYPCVYDLCVIKQVRHRLKPKVDFVYLSSVGKPFKISALYIKLVIHMHDSF